MNNRNTFVHDHHHEQQQQQHQHQQQQHLNDETINNYNNDENNISINMDNPSLEQKFQKLEKRFVDPLNNNSENMSSLTHNASSGSSSHSHSHEANDNQMMMNNRNDDDHHHRSNDSNAENDNASHQSFAFTSPSKQLLPNRGTSTTAHTTRTTTASPQLMEVNRCADIHLHNVAKIYSNLSSTSNISRSRSPLPLPPTTTMAANHQYSNGSKSMMSMSSNQTLITAHVQVKKNQNDHSNGNHIPAVNTTTEINQSIHNDDDNSIIKNNKGSLLQSPPSNARRAILNHAFPSSKGANANDSSGHISSSNKRKSHPMKYAKPSLSMDKLNNNNDHKNDAKTNGSKRFKNSSSSISVANTAIAATNLTNNNNNTTKTTTITPPVISPDNQFKHSSSSSPPRTRVSTATITNSNISTVATHSTTAFTKKSQITNYFQVKRNKKQLKLKIQGGSGGNDNRKNNQKGNQGMNGGASTIASATYNNEIKGLSTSAITATMSAEDVSSKSSSITASSITHQRYETERTQYKEQLNQYQSQLASLHSILQDKGEQLNAVRNNHTIQNVQLNAQLVQCQESIKKMNNQEDSMKRRITLYQSTMEQLIRKDCQREQNLKRQKLASDGARLGRWVYNRVGMRVEPIWEDGTVNKELKQKKVVLKLKRQALEMKLENGFKTCDDNINGVDDNAFEREEFEQSIQFHLEEVEREAKKLQREEDSLRLEKAAHKRELRRVANEDASRFKKRPKVCALIFCNCQKCLRKDNLEILLFLSSMTDTYYCTNSGKEDSLKFGEPMILLNYVKWL